MRSIPDKLLENPSFATYYAVILADSDQIEEAAKYLELAQRGTLLPQERNLLEKTKTKLAHRGSAPEHIR